MVRCLGWEEYLPIGYLKLQLARVTCLIKARSMAPLHLCQEILNRSGNFQRSFKHDHVARALHEN